MSIIILWGTLSSQNRGVNALTRSAINIISSLYPTEEVILIGSGELRPIAIDKLRFLPMPTIKDLLKHFLLKSVKINFALNEHVKDAKVVLDLSEGDSFTDIYGQFRFWFQTITKLSFRKTAPKYIFLPQTIGPFENYFVMMAAKNILCHVDSILVRDDESKDLVKRLTNRESIFCYDLGFALEPKIPARCKYNISKKIGINISGLLWFGGYTKNNQFNLIVDYRNMMKYIILYFIRNGYSVILIPHTYGDTEEDDLVASEQLKESLENFGENIEIIEEYYTEQELKWIISNLEFFLGSRMHSCIASLSAGIPAIGLGYSRKFKGIFDSINGGDYVIDLRKTKEDDVLIKIDRLFKERDAFQKHLLKINPDINKKIYKTIKNILND